MVADDQHWATRGACRSRSPDELFVEGAAQRAAREVCAGCSVRLECLVDALDHHIAFGVWGGMTERERRALLRRHPDVESWWEMLQLEPGLARIEESSYRPRVHSDPSAARPNPGDAAHVGNSTPERREGGADNRTARPARPAVFRHQS